MTNTAIKKSIFLLLISFILIGILNQSWKAPITHDETLDNIFIHNKAPLSFKNWILHKEDFVHINYLADFSYKTEKLSPTEDLKLLLDKMHYAHSYGPILLVLAKIPFLKDQVIWGQRLIYFAFYCFGLLILNLLMKELAFNQDQRYISLLFAVSTCIAQTTIIHGRAYASNFFLLPCILFFLTRLYKSPKKGSGSLLYYSITFLLIHLCFLNHFFNAIYLPIIFLGFSAYLFFNRDELSVQVKRFLPVSIFFLFSFLSLSIYLLFSYSFFSINTKVSSWMGRADTWLGTFESMFLNLKAFTTNYISDPYGYLIFIALISLALIKKEQKQILILFLIVISILVAIAVTGMVSDRDLILVSRYSFIAMPFLYMIYGIVFNDKLKALGLLLITVFHFINLLPNKQFIKKIFTKEYFFSSQRQYPKLSKNLIDINLNKSTLVLFNADTAIDNFIFSREFLANTENSSRLLKSNTDKEIFINTNPFEFKLNESLDFIEKNSIKQILFSKNQNESKNANLMHVIDTIKQNYQNEITIKEINS